MVLQTKLNKTLGIFEWHEFPSIWPTIAEIGNFMPLLNCAILQNQGLRVFLVSGSSKDIRTLYVALVHRVESLKNSISHSSSSSSSPKKAEETTGSTKRKLDDIEESNSRDQESPPPEKEPKVD